MGGIVAGLLGDVLPWRTAYYVGGGMGLLLLALRVGVHESGMFAGVKQRAGVRRGDFFALFTNFRRLRRYVAVILSGLPIWFVFAILVSLAPEMGAALGLDPAPTAAKAVLWAYVGIALGDLASGTLSQWLRIDRLRMPLVRQARATVVGPLDKDVVRRTVREHINDIRRCYDEGLAIEPRLHGRVAVDFTILGDGKVGTSAISESSLDDADVDACIEAAFRRWRFPRPAGGEQVTVTYPFLLEPG